MLTMNYFRVAYFLLSLLIVSCSRGLIPDNDMPRIIAEIYKTDRYMSSDYMLTLKSDTTRIYESVLNNYGYTSEQLINTIEHHLWRPSKLKQFYQEALAIVQEEQAVVKSAIEAKSREELHKARFLEILSDSTTIKYTLGRERAFRWIVSPNTHPILKVIYNDSLMHIYETPQMVKWWQNNFQKDSIRTQYITFKDEKDRRTLHNTLKLRETFEKRAGSTRR